ncbi:adenosylcobinamide amidohydrolase [Methanobrevibacter oralis]|uniref:adenosylcobinamide amidohydrolase n=1 Tax=Methanobrevibacter oralis TaxID=66851 RepID=UPI0021C34582|nr:adenosylcobinamide amidohydrolase [Methanobrevibacter oralis]
MYNNRIIFKTSDRDEIFYLKDSILINFLVNRNGISTSELNSGFSDNFKSVFNHHLSQKSLNFLENHDVKDYLINHCSYLDIDSNSSTGLITLAKMNNVSIVSKNFKN